MADNLNLDAAREALSRLGRDDAPYEDMADGLRDALTAVDTLSADLAAVRLELEAMRGERNDAWQLLTNERAVLRSIYDVIETAGVPDDVGGREAVAAAEWADEPDPFHKETDL